MPRSGVECTVNGGRKGDANGKGIVMGFAEGNVMAVNKLTLYVSFT